HRLVHALRTATVPRYPLARGARPPTMEGRPASDRTTTSPHAPLQRQGDPRPGPEGDTVRLWKWKLFRLSTALASLALVAPSPTRGAEGPGPVEADVVLKGGTVVDGTG